MDANEFDGAVARHRAAVAAEPLHQVRAVRDGAAEQRAALDERIVEHEAVTRVVLDEIARIANDELARLRDAAAVRRAATDERIVTAEAEIKRLRAEIAAARAEMAEDDAHSARRQEAVAAEAKARAAAETVTRDAGLAELRRLRAAFDRMVCDLAVPVSPDPLVAAAALLPEEE